MNDSIIICPSCKTDIKLTESLAGPLVEQARREYELKYATKEAELSSKLKADRTAIAAEEAAKIKASVTDVFNRKQAELDQTILRLKEQEDKLAQAQQAEVELLRKTRELEDARREMGLKIEQGIQNSLNAEREKARAEAEALHGPKLRAYEQRIAETETELKQGRQILERERLAISERLEAERQRIADEESAKSRLVLEDKQREVASLEGILKDREVKLAEAQQAEVELLRKTRELEDARREMELKIEQGIQNSLGVEREKARAEAEAQHGTKLRAYEQRIAETEAELKQGQQALESERLAISERIEIERQRIANEEAAKSRLALEDRAREVTSLTNVLKERETKLAEAQKAQAEVLRQQRELEDQKRELELTVERRVCESEAAVREKARQDLESVHRLKVAEKEQTILSMQRQIEELGKKAEQSSQQLQGEVQELDLEAILKTRFREDSIESVGKGEFGGDILQRVFTPGGKFAGTILWESKRTKNWSETWLPKLRDDQRSAKAEVAILTSQALPRDVNGFDLRDGIWVTDYRFAVPIAIALRQGLCEVADVRQTSEGQQTKMAQVYEYLTGPRFRLGVSAILEKSRSMKEDLDRERKALMRLWAKREEQIRGVETATAVMYGDLQGIVGRRLNEIESLEVLFLSDGVGGTEQPESHNRALSASAGD